MAPPLTPGESGNISSGGPIFVPSTPAMPINPGVVTGGTAGTSVSGSGGNVWGGVSSGGTVFTPAAPSTAVTPGGATGGAAGAPVPGSVGNNGNLSSGAGSGGVAVIPGTQITPVNPGVVTGGGSGLPLPGSVVVIGASPIPSVSTGGAGSVVPSVAGESRPGSLGSGSASPIPGGASMGTNAPGEVVGRLPGSIDAQSRPSGGMNGFGTVAGGMSNLKPNNIVESGEESGVDASEIPQVGGGMRPGGGPAAAGSTPANRPNANSGTNGVGSGLLSVVMPPKSSSPIMGTGAGISGQGGVVSSTPAAPSITIVDNSSSGTVIKIPGSPSVSATGITPQNTPALRIPKNPAISHPITQPHQASPVSSGITVSVITPA